MSKRYCSKMWRYTQANSVYVDYVRCTRQDGRPSPIRDGSCIVCGEEL